MEEVLKERNGPETSVGMLFQEVFEEDFPVDVLNAGVGKNGETMAFFVFIHDFVDEDQLALSDHSLVF